MKKIENFLPNFIFYTTKMNTCEHKHENFCWIKGEFECVDCLRIVKIESKKQCNHEHENFCWIKGDFECVDCLHIRLALKPIKG
jgi:hypothetical protein